MPSRYIALLGEHARGEEALAAVQNDTGLVPRTLPSGLQLFTSRETPTLSIPGGGILLGRLFRRDGSAFTCPAEFPSVSCWSQMCAYILECCWGDYILFYPDSQRATGVVVLRDPSGGLPCVYSLEASRGFLTSDISLAVELGVYRKQVDWDFIAYCTQYPHTMTERTGLAGIRELLPGCLLRVGEKTSVAGPMWSPWDFVAPGQRLGDPFEAANGVRQGVSTAVRAWARLDRSILLELSGGLDSSIIAACLRDAGTDVSCCTLRTTVPGADERQYARQVADALGVKLRVEELAFGLARFGAPPPEWSVSPRINVLQHALNEAMTAVGVSEAVTSHFSGGGGDSVFCYLGNAAPAADAYRELGLGGGFRAIQDLSNLHQCTLWKALRLTLAKMMGPAMAPAVPVTTLLSRQVPISPPDNHPWLDPPPGALPGDGRRIGHLAGTQLYRHAIWRGAARELRMPLLSQPVVEACLRAPAWMWISGGRNRSLARSAFENDLPPAILNRRSKGDFAQYLGGVWHRSKHAMREFLLEGELNARGLLEPQAIDGLFRKRLPPRDRSFHRVFELCTIENWARHQH